MNIKSIMRFHLVALALVMLNGCAITAVEMVQHGKEYIFGKEVNLVAKNYAAADYVLQNAGNRINKYQLTVAYPLKNLDAPKLTSDFASIIVRQVGERMLQLGYEMDLSYVANPGDDSYARKSPDLVRNILTGTYRMHGDSYIIDLRIIKGYNKTITSSFTYTIPINTDTREMAKPQPIIEVIKKEQQLPLR